MRKVDGERFYTIGEVAAEVGVSPQTLRVWERKGHVSPRRSRGGQRLYSREELRTAQNVRRLGAGRRWHPSIGSSSLALEQAPQPSSSVLLGMRIRATRRERGLSDLEAARRIGISRSFLGTIERGESGASPHVMARIADALNMPQSAFSIPTERSDGSVMRAHHRPRTPLRGGVCWEELASLGHTLEPALLIVPAGAGSGGPYSRSGESFAYVLAGRLSFRLGNSDSEVTLDAGDSIIVPRHSAMTWHNPGRVEARAVWVEQLPADAWRESPQIDS
jgi:transcriptional regulator with XRE-family HTH domain